MSDVFVDVPSVRRGLEAVGYLADDAIATTVFLAGRMGKPVLVEGPAGTGKTELAKALARLSDRRLVRLQCYEGLDESKALYEWDYKKQLLRIQAAGEWDAVHDDIFGPEYLLSRPLLEAVRSTEPVVLLIDEVDRVEMETEALLLEVLSDFQVTIPEMGTVTAARRPLVVLTSNDTRDLSEALKRRCLYLHLDYPTPEREKEILRLHLPDIDDELAAQTSRAVQALRELDLRKQPSVSEAIDWARSLQLLNVTTISVEEVKQGLPILLKYGSDIAKAAAALEKS